MRKSPTGPEPENPEIPPQNRVKKFFGQEHLPQPPFVGQTPLPASLVLPVTVTVRELAAMLHRKAFVVLKVLVDADVFANPSAPLDFQTASMVCRHFGVAATCAEEL
jgi:hypothetical protein